MLLLCVKMNFHIFKLAEMWILCLLNFEHFTKAIENNVCNRVLCFPVDGFRSQFQPTSGLRYISWRMRQKFFMGGGTPPIGFPGFPFTCLMKDLWPQNRQVAWTPNQTAHSKQKKTGTLGLHHMPLWDLDLLSFPRGSKFSSQNLLWHQKQSNFLLQKCRRGEGIGPSSPETFRCSPGPCG